MLPGTAELTRWLLAATAMYLAALAANRLLRLAVSTVALVLLAGYIANPSDPMALPRQVAEAAREPLGQLLNIAIAVWRILWQYILSTVSP